MKLVELNLFVWILYYSWDHYNWKSRYFALTELNNYFIIHHRDCSSINKLIDWKGSAIFPREGSRGEKRDSFTHKHKYYLQLLFTSIKTKLNTVGGHCAWADHYLPTVFCRSPGGLWASKKEKNDHDHFCCCHYYNMWWRGSFHCRKYRVSAISFVSINPRLN